MSLQCVYTAKSRPREDISFSNSSNRTSVIKNGGSHNLFLTVDVDKDAASGIYSVPFEFSFVSGSKETFSSTSTMYIKIDNGRGVPTVILDNFKSDKDTVVIGNTFNITSTLQNTTDIDANTISVEVIGIEDYNISILGSSNTVSFSTMKGNESKDISFNFSTYRFYKRGFK